jgi:uroporphyrinogen III methyltransferase/synthase
VLVTRPRAQADALVDQLEAAGATAVIAPAIQIAPPEDSGPLLKAAAEASQFDWIVFASANAVDAFVGAATVSRWPNIAAVGTRTAERIREHGLDATVVPSEFRAEALVESLAARTPLAGTRVLLPRSDIGRDAMADGLRAAGACVTDVVAYRTIAESPAEDSPDVMRMLVDRELDAVTFTSGSAVRHFVQRYGPDSVPLLGNTVVAVIGPVTADAARELSVPVHVQPATYTTADMVAALEAHFRSRS